MQDHYWIVEYLTEDAIWTCWSAHPTRSEARAAAELLDAKTRTRKFIAA